MGIGVRARVPAAVCSIHIRIPFKIQHWYGWLTMFLRVFFQIERKKEKPHFVCEWTSMRIERTTKTRPQNYKIHAWLMLHTHTSYSYVSCEALYVIAWRETVMEQQTIRSAYSSTQSITIKKKEKIQQLMALCAKHIYIIHNICIHKCKKKKRNEMRKIFKENKTFNGFRIHNKADAW